MTQALPINGELEDSGPQREDPAPMVVTLILVVLVVWALVAWWRQRKG